MKEWDAIRGEYVDPEEFLQDDTKDEKDEPDAKIKIKLRGKPAMDLIKAIAPDLKKSAKKTKSKPDEK